LLRIYSPGYCFYNALILLHKFILAVGSESAGTKNMPQNAALRIAVQYEAFTAPGMPGKLAKRPKKRDLRFDRRADK